MPARCEPRAGLRVSNRRRRGGAPALLLSLLLALARGAASLLRHQAGRQQGLGLLVAAAAPRLAAKCLLTSRLLPSAAAGAAAAAAPAASRCDADSSCPAAVRPVCGADGRSYTNACVADCAAVAVAHAGYCAGAATRGGRSPFTPAGARMPAR